MKRHAWEPTDVVEARAKPSTESPTPPSPTAKTRFRILGSLEVERGGNALLLGSPQQRTVLALLLVRANELVPAEALVEDLWGDDPPDSARNTLYTYVSHLRKVLDAGRIQSQAPGYRLVLEPSELDAARFEKLLRDATKTRDLDPAIAATVLDEALGLWRGPALSDVAGHGALLAEASRLDELRLVAGEERIEALLAAGEPARVIGEAEVLLDRHPLRERLWRQLMLALYREGRQAEALNAFQRVREVLADELGIDPSPEVARLHEKILRQDPGLELRGEPLRGYRLLERIGEGPSGVVFRAIQPHVGRDVAVKIFHEHIASDPSFARRFEREAQAATALEHPHVAPVYDYWREPDRAYVVSRYLRGGSLAALVARGERLDRDVGLLVVEQVASALAFAHHAGVAHGRVDDSNVLFDGERNAYLADFRVALGPPPDPADDVRELAALARGVLDDPIPTALAGLIEKALLGTDVPEAGAFALAVRATAEPETAPGPRPEDVRNPYKGLRAFTEADAADFFGRGELVARLIARLGGADRASRFLAVVGPSGCGKSSVVRAGVVPGIRRGALGDPHTTFVAEMFPGAHPVEELEAVLLRVATRPATRVHDLLDRGSRGLLEATELVLPAAAELVLVVDQFEELFTLTADEHERELFLESLRVATAEPDSRVRVVVTLRADFYDRPLNYPRFGELLATTTEAVPPLTPDELEQAIRRPTEGVGVTPEPGLVAEIIADVAGQPGALPLLQYALTEMFERRDGDRLALAGFRAIGGVGGALGARADRIYEAMTPDGRHAARQVLLRLVHLGDGRQDTRRRVAQGELDDLFVDPHVVGAVLDTYGHHRLLTFDREPSTREPTVEIAHEALLTAWPRLGTWIDDAREDLRQDRRLETAAGEWRGSDRDPSFLLRGARLEQVETWVRGTDLAIGRHERAYLKASIDRRGLDVAEERARLDREARTERRSRSRLRALVVVLSVAALVASGLTVVATRQSDRAESEARVARARELAAAALANLELDPERSLLLALEAVDETRSVDGSVLPEAVDALHQAVGASRAVMTLHGIGGSVDWDPSGRYFVAEGPLGTGEVQVRDAETGERLQAIGAHNGDVTDLVFSPDGSQLATTGTDGKLNVWDPTTGDLLASLAGKGPAEGPSFTSDGRLVAAAWSRDKAVRLLDTSTRRIVRTLLDVGRPVDTTFSPDGRRIALSSGVVLDARSGEQVLKLQGELQGGAVSWSPDGRYIANAWPTWIWDASTGDIVFEAAGHQGAIQSVDWSPDSTRLVTGGNDGTVRVWEIGDDGAREVTRLATLETASDVFEAAFSSDGDRVVAGDGGEYFAGPGNTTVKVWDLTPAATAEWAVIPTDGEYPGDVEFAPTGRRLYANDGVSSVSLWDLQIGQGDAPLRTLDLGRHPSVESPFVWRIDADPDGTTVAVTFQVGTRLRDAVTGDGMSRIEGSVDVAWHPSGDRLAVAYLDGRLAILDRSGREIRALDVDEGSDYFDLEFSPDGRMLASTDVGETLVRIWDWERGEVITEILTESQFVSFDPTGDRIVTSPPDRPPSVWDVRSGELISTLAGQAGAFVYEPTFSPDGSVVATGSSSGVQLLDPDSGVQVLSLQGHTGYVARVAFSPDGSMLASRSPSSVSGDGTVRVWALDIGDLLQIAHRKVTRSLTDEECRQYLDVASCPVSPASP